jgi:periplasmic protein TonB
LLSLQAIKEEPRMENLPLAGPFPLSRHRTFTAAVSVVAHALLLASVLVLPLFFRQSLPEPTGEVRAFFAEPISIAPPPPPPAAPRAHARSARPSPSKESGALLAPSVIPAELTPEDGIDLGSEGGVPGGVEGGVPGGVVGGVVGGLPDAPAPPPAHRLRAGRDISPPRRLREVSPVYPRVARLSRLEGVVVVECVIDEHGRVQNATVLKGAPLLDDAALDAVRQWAYAPSLLNGVPVEVVMTVTVTFQLR